MITSNTPLPSCSTQTTSPSHTSFSNQPLSRFRKFLSKFKRTPQRTQSDSTRHSSNNSYHTEQSAHQQSFPPHHPRQSYEASNCDSTTTAYHSLAPLSSPATTSSGTAASPSPPATAPSGATASPPPPATTPSDVTTSPSPPATTPSGVTASPSPPATTLSGATASPSSQVTTLSAGATASASTPAHQHPLSPAMQQYVSYLKNRYNNITTPVYDKEHSLLQVKAKYFINIALVHKDSPQYMKDSDRNEMIMDRLHGHVDAIQETKTKLFIHDVCKSQDGRLARSVLVEGAPGVGKTTFAFELCSRWARGEILWVWAAVVLIKLRDHTTRTAKNMYDLLYHPRPELRQAVVDELIDHDGGCILLILDGYDELTDSQKESTSVIQQIMSKKLLCQSTLLVTSRPLATRTLCNDFKWSIDQHIEVLGFTEKNIKEYIQSACGDKPELVEDFNSYLSSHPFSSALMFNPLQCAIVTNLYRSHWESGDKKFAPKTLTELYTGLVHIMLLRYLTQHPVYKDRDWWISDLSDLPEEVRQQLKAVTELAAKGTRNQQYVFDEVNTNIPSETLGLMQKEEVVVSERGISASHNFLHLTLQEYLAAVNYTQQYSSPEQLSQLMTQDNLFTLNNFLKHYGKKIELTSHFPVTHWPVVLFVAGRTKLSGVPTNIFKMGLCDSDDDDDITTVNVSLLHLLYETQSSRLIQSTLVTSRKYLSVSGSSALDWFVIGYCISNSTSTWRVEKKGNSSFKYFDQLIMGLRLGPEECSSRECKIGFLHISGHWTGNWKILTQLQPCAKLVTKVNLVCYKQSEQCDLELSKRKSVFGEATQYPMLEELTIKNAESSCSASLLGFTSQHSNLRILSLKQCDLSSISTSSLIHFLQSPSYRLNKLTLDDCNIQIPDHTNSESTAIYHQLQMELISPTANGSFSLGISGSLYTINYILSQPHLVYTNTLTILRVAIVNETPNSLQTSFYPNLETLRIDSSSKKDTAYLHSFHFSSHANNLLTVSLTRCHLRNEGVLSLIHFLQSPNNRLHKLILDDCTIQIPDHTNSESAAISYQLQMELISPTATRNFSLEISSSLCAINYILSQPHQFYVNTLTILKVTVLRKNTDALQILKTVSKSKKDTDYLHSFLFSSYENKLHTLSLMRSNLSNEGVLSLIHFLQSPNNRLHNLTLDDCTIQIPDHINSESAAISCKLRKELISPTATESFSLEISGSLYAINYLLSQPDLFYTNTLAFLKVVILSGNTDSLQTFLYLNLATLKIISKSEEKPAYLHCFPFCPHENNLHTLSLRRCHLSNECFSSLIHFLQSPNNKLHKLTLDDCTIQIPDYTNSVAISYYLTSPTGTGNFSLEISSSLYATNYILSQPHQFYSNTLTILKVDIMCGSTDSLRIETSFYPHLNVLDITSWEKKNCTLLHDSVFHIILQQNTLRIMSLKRCNTTRDTVRPLILSLQSSHCELQEVTLDDCISDHTDTTITSSKLKLKSLDNGNVSLEFTGYCCDISHWLSQLSSYTQLTELILYLDGQNSTTADILQEILLYYHVLKSLMISKSPIYSIPYTVPLPLSIPQFIELQQNNLCNLSLRRCNLSSDVTRSFIHSLQSPHCRLHKLTMYKCTISTPNETQQNTFSTKNNTTLCSLVTTDSLCVLNHILSNVIFKHMTELSLCITTHSSSEAEVLAKILVSCPVLETMKIDSSVSLSLSLSIPQFTELQQNNLHTLSLSMFNISSDVTRSLIHSLQSPHCSLLKLMIDHCTISTTDETQLKTISTNNNTTLCSLVTTDSLCVLNHILSNVVFTQMTKLSLCITTNNSSEELEVLTMIPISCPVLKTINIDRGHTCSLSFLLSIPQFIGSHLHTLSMSKYNLSSDVTMSLIHSLQSPHCILHKLALKKCTISFPEDSQQTTILMKMNVALHSLDISWSVLDQMMSCINPFTQSLTELILHVDSDTHTCTSGVETILQEIPSKCPLLETLKIDRDFCIKFSLPLSIPEFIGTQPNNLHTLSLSRCNLSSDVTRSFIHHSLHSLHCTLQNLALKECTISLPGDAQQTTMCTKRNLMLHSLDIPWSVLNQMMSCISPFSQSLTELILHVDKGTSEVVETMLQEIPSNCPLLKNLKIDSSVRISLPLSIPQFIGSQQNNLHTLSLRRCNFSSDVTWSLIHSLQSTHCKLYKLALYDCTISYYTQLTTAIVSSTTITHLLLIDENIDTPSLTALASGLKHNTTIEQLAVDKGILNLDNSQLKLLFDAVNNSTVKKLWVDDNYENSYQDTACLNDYRTNVNIEWYSFYHHLYNKW